MTEEQILNSESETVDLESIEVEMPDYEKIIESINEFHQINNQKLMDEYESKFQKQEERILDLLSQVEILKKQLLEQKRNEIKVSTTD